MKVGDYVRTKEFGISKAKWFDNNEPILENGFTALQKEYKSSPSIIDLIEVGDYVNGCPVLHKENNELVCGLLLRYKEENIQNVVTKEQFKSMEYKVKE